MASLLSIKDSFQIWIDKVNAILTLNTVDGNFRLESSEELYVIISAGKMRKMTDIVVVPTQSFTITPDSTTIVGVDSLNNVLVAHNISSTPTSDFIPLWKFVTTSVIIETTDLRTWVVA
jgi:hypothetical protein